MQPGRENWLGSAGSANANPSLDTLRNIKANMCCATVARSACPTAGCTVPYWPLHSGKAVPAPLSAVDVDIIISPPR